MPYTENQEAAFKSEFAVRRRRQMIAAVPMLIAMIALVALGSRESRMENSLVEQVMFFIPTLFFLGGLFFSFSNWRCPACKKYLGKTLNPAFCGRCGVKLR